MSYYCGPETKQRILACLKLNNGVLEDDKGHVYRKLWHFMAHPPNTMSTLRSNVRALEQKGYLLRDVRPTKKSNNSSPIKSAGDGCFALLLVDSDIDVEEWAMVELREQITSRMMGKSKAVNNKNKTPSKTFKTPPPNSSPVPKTQSGLHSGNTLDDSVSLLAHSLLEQVVGIINNPPMIEVEVNSAELESKNRLLQENLDKMKKCVEDQDREIQGLRKQLEVAKSARAHLGLTQAVRDTLTAEQWAQLQRQAPGNSK